MGPREVAHATGVSTKTLIESARHNRRTPMRRAIDRQRALR
jgi:hypothetical protein